MSQLFYTYPDGSHVNTAHSNAVRTPENSGPVHSSAVSIQSNNNTFRQRWQTSSDSNTMAPQDERVGEPLIFSPIVAEEIVPDGVGEDEVPHPLPPRSPERTTISPATAGGQKGTRQQRQYSDFEYGTMCFLALCTFLGALGLVIALVVGALDILARLLGRVGGGLA